MVYVLHERAGILHTILEEMKEVKQGKGALPPEIQK